MEFQEPILNEWKHHSEEEMIPNVLNMTQMAQHPPIGSAVVPTKAIIYGKLLVVTWKSEGVLVMTHTNRLEFT